MSSFTHARPARADLGGVPAVRAVILAGFLLAGSALVRGLAVPPLLRVTTEVPSARVPLSDLVAAGCGAALLACWAWCVLAAVAVAVDALRARSGRRSEVAGAVHCPRLVQFVVLALLGIGYGVQPAVADAAPRSGADDSGGAPLAGLRLPDRQLSPAAAGSGTVSAHRERSSAKTPTAGVAIRVATGDSLWSLAKRHLPAAATDADIDRGWRRIARANADVIGADPDLIFPDTTLWVPVLDSADREDH
ncbi:hypothetical protein BH18ACT9_BH18ACT9_06900 [soil metagenome]